MANTIRVTQIDDGSFLISVVIMSEGDICQCQDYELSAQNPAELKAKLNRLIDDMFLRPAGDVFDKIFEQAAEARSEDEQPKPEEGETAEIEVLLPVKSEDDTPISQMYPEKKKTYANKMMR
jgi:hypothetical protein